MPDCSLPLGSSSHSPSGRVRAGASFACNFSLALVKNQFFPSDRVRIWSALRLKSRVLSVLLEQLGELLLQILAVEVAGYNLSGAVDKNVCGNGRNTVNLGTIAAPEFEVGNLWPRQF